MAIVSLSAALTDGPKGDQRVVDRLEVGPFLLLAEDQRAAQDEHGGHAELHGDQFEARHLVPTKAEQALESRQHKRDDCIQPFANRLEHDQIQWPRYKNTFRPDQPPASVSHTLRRRCRPCRRFFHLLQDACRGEMNASSDEKRPTCFRHDISIA